MKINFVYPTRSRPNEAKKTILTYISMQSSMNFSLHINCDIDDITMNNENMIEWMNKQSNTTILFSNSKSKIEAINRPFKCDGDIVFLISDDMKPKTRGFDEIIRQDMATYFPNLDGALWYDDGRRKADICTLQIMGANLYKQLKCIYCPSFKSLYCDNYFTDLCQKFNKIKYIDNVIVKHEWPGGGSDDLMRRNEALYNTDKKTYKKLKELLDKSDTIEEAALII